MPLFFVITELNYEYGWQDFYLVDLAFDYALDIHEIPKEYIESIEVFASLQKIEITLNEDRSMIREDWYQLLLQYSA